MPSIQLSGPKSSNFSVLVSPEDFDYLSQFKWNRNPGTGYAVRTVYIPVIPYRHRIPRLVFMHLVVATRACMVIPPKHEVDHKNMDKLDNTRDNLRIATSRQNTINRGKDSRNKSGYKGVSWAPHAKKWRACIGIYGKVKTLGYFTDPKEAHAAYLAAAKAEHGEFARGE